MEYTNGSYQFFDKKVHFKTWSTKETDDIVLITHGIAEHSGRYIELAEYLASQGYKVYAYDHLGHGLSEGKRGHTRCFKEYIHLLASFIEFIYMKENKKIILLGHSLATLIILNYLLSSPGHSLFIKKLVLSAPAIDTGVPNRGIIKVLTHYFAFFFPLLRLPDFIKGKQLTRDKKDIIARENDPLIIKRSSLTLFSQMFKHMDIIQHSNLNFKVPTYVLIAGADTVVDNIATKKLLNDVDHEGELTVKEYDGAHHEMFHDIIKKEVFENLNKWLRA